MLLNSKSLKELKISLYHSQNKICPLCKNLLSENIQSNHLDHSHELTGRNVGKVRSLLCLYCNPLEGSIHHSFNSSGLKDKTDYIKWLKRLIKYLESDYSLNDTHPNFVGDSVRAFKKKTVKAMQDELKQKGVEPVKGKDNMIKQYRQAIKKGLN